MRHLFTIALIFLLLAPPAQAQNDVRFQVLGGPDELRDALIAASRLQAVTDEEDSASQDIVAAARFDYARLLAVLYEQGYFGPDISITLNGREVAGMSPFDRITQVRSAAITVEPGRAFRLGRAVIAPLAPGTDLPEGFRSGAPAGTVILRETTEAGIMGWRSQGHATADVGNQQITARHNEAELDAEITLAPGPVYRFGTLIPQGEERMRTRRVLRIAGLPTGEVYDPDEVDRAADRLRDTGVFTSVGFTEIPNPDGTLDVQAELVEAPLRRVGFGAEIQSQDGLTVSGYWLHRNLFGGAERLRFDAEISDIGAQNSGIDGFVSGLFSRPADLTPDTTLELGFRIEHLDEPTFVEDTASINIGLEHQFSDELTATAGVFARYSDVSDNFSDRSVWMVGLPLGLTWDSRDNAFDAASGWYADATLTPFTAFEDGGGIRATADLRAYYGFGEEDSTRLAGRLQLGTVDGGDISALPPDWLFYSGGSGTVRGQDYQSLGAMQNGVQTGGRSFAGASFEIRQDLFGNFGAVAFYDVGYVSAGAYGEGASDWHSGAGLGLRYDTPIGPIRLDIATPVSGDGTGEDVHLYLGIGQNF